jgi:hypothetical protein
MSVTRYHIRFVIEAIKLSVLIHIMFLMERYILKFVRFQI